MEVKGTHVNFVGPETTLQIPNPIIYDEQDANNLHAF